MTKVFVVFGSVMFALGAIAGHSMISPAPMQAAKDHSMSTFELQRNAPADLVVQQYEAV